MQIKLKHFESFFVQTPEVGETLSMGALIAQLKGAVHVGRLQESLDRALDQHPALRAQLTELSGPKGEIHQEWRMREKVHVPLRLAETSPPKQGAPSSLFDHPIDLTRESAVRVSLVKSQVDGSANQSEWLFWLDFHPALCDGPGAVRFFEDTLVAYAYEHGADRTPDLGLFEERSMDLSPPFHPAYWILWLLRLGVALFGVLWQSLRGKNSQKNMPTPSLNSASNGDKVLFFQLTPEQTDTFSVVGRRSGGRTIHVILRDILLAFREGAKSRVLGWGDDILLERSQRSGGRPSRFPQGHLSSLTWFHLSSAAGEDRSSLLKHAIHKLAHLNDQSLSPLDLRVLLRMRQAFLRYFPNLRSLVPWPLIFTDVGVPFAGSFLPREADGAVVSRGVKVESMAILPSHWGIGGWSLGVIQYRNAMRFALRGDGHWVTSDVLQMIMGHLEERFYATASEPGRENLALEALIQAHAKLKQDGSPLRGLPIGKHVAPEASTLKSPRHLGADLMGRPSPRDSSSPMADIPTTSIRN